jgi:putative methyltransferase (TIGR04325 family)
MFGNFVFAKQLLPPLVITLLKKILRKQRINFINYSTWEEAENAAEGYDSDNIILKIKNSAKLVFEKKAVYERDSVIFNEIHYSYPLLASLIFVSENSESLRIIDFGGAFGTTFQQNLKFLSKLKNNVDWRIVEQEKIVEIGKKEFIHENLSFYNTIEDSFKGGIDAILFCSSICYIPNSYNYLYKAIDLKAPFIIFDRTPITNEVRDTFAVQKVPPSIYKASYPIRNFSYTNFIKIFELNYDLIEEWVCDLQPDPQTKAMGFIFKKKQNIELDINNT